MWEKNFPERPSVCVCGGREIEKEGEGERRREREKEWERDKRGI